MTITIKKSHLAFAVLAVALIIPATSQARHVFDDVPDDRFFSVPVEWAFDNELTTGSPSGSGNFLPFDDVTRAENITFNYRYDQNIVQPALAAAAAAAAASGGCRSTEVGEHRDRRPRARRRRPPRTSLTCRSRSRCRPGRPRSRSSPSPAENQCEQNPVVSAWCFIELELDGTTAPEAVRVFNSVQQGANSTRHARVRHHTACSGSPVRSAPAPIRSRRGSASTRPTRPSSSLNPTMTVLRMPAANAVTLKQPRAVQRRGSRTSSAREMTGAGDD